MVGLSRTLGNLARYRRAMENGAVRPRAPAAPSRLRECAVFGENPGNLRMLTYVPENLPASPALVVVLHGCTQTAAAYDHGAGWSRLADEAGFVLLFPEQQPANNPKNCFTWFDANDTRRDAGEALSIRSMVARMVEDHGIDPGRVFVTGLSAGGAMANVMLATYPEVFAGGAVIAGLPYGAAASVPQAFEAMFKGANRPAREWGDLVRAASPYRGPWPRISVWQGSADRTVVASNAEEIVKQWADVHDLSPATADREPGSAFSREVWRDADGRILIERVTIPGMAHGTPLAVGAGEDQGGNAGPFLLDVGVSSTHHIARFFGLLDARAEARARAESYVAAAASDPTWEPLSGDLVLPGDITGSDSARPAANRAPIDVHGVIANALRAAGLMRP